MAEKRGMGRGLSAILPVREDDLVTDELRQVPVAAIDANPDQPRTTFDADELTALAESIRQNGVLQPLLVRPLEGGRYELVAGERRLRASTLAGLETVPAYVRAGLDANKLELALIENMARVDLNPIDAARACAALVDDLGLTKEEVARRIGKSRVAVSNLVRLLNLPDDVIEMIERGELSEGHGRALLRAGDHFSRRRLARQAADNSWSVRETEHRAELEASTLESKAKPERDGSMTGAATTESAEIAEARTVIADHFTRLLGSEPKVKVTPRGIKVQFEFADAAEAIAVATRTPAK
ncbi:MAG: ParB/RepB/Spo0J family partition protein [Actinobacteria bacterium]|nr:ParB/RepB/Spo0J family partition protein [Actinomycetota bacterium]